jgi:hypothetical protein
VISSLGGFIIFYVALRFLADRLSVGLKGFWRDGPIALLLSFAATGMRGPFGPVLICVSGALVLLPIVRDRRLDAASIAVLIGSACGSLLALRIFFTLGSGFSSVSFIKMGQTFTWLSDAKIFYVVEMFKEFGASPLLAGSVGFFVMALMQAEFLMPAFLYACVRMRYGFSSGEYVLVATSLAGISGTMLTEAPGGSHFSFMHLANLSMSLLGGLGLCRAVQAIRGEKSVSRKIGGYAVIGGVMTIAIFSAYDLGVQINTYRKQLFSKPVYYSIPEITPLFRNLSRQDCVLLLTNHQEKVNESNNYLILEYAVRSGVQFIGDISSIRQYVDWKKDLGLILLRRVDFMIQAQRNIDKGELHVADVQNISSSLLTSAKQACVIFVIAPSDVSVIGDTNALREIARTDRYVLHKFSN